MLRIDHVGGLVRLRHASDLLCGNAIAATQLPLLLCSNAIAATQLPLLLCGNAIAATHLRASAVQ